MPLYEWLLEEAKSLGVHGGSAFRAIAGFGRHGRMHEDTFFELAGELAVKVEFRSGRCAGRAVAGEDTQAQHECVLSEADGGSRGCLKSG